MSNEIKVVGRVSARKLTFLRNGELVDKWIPFCKLNGESYALSNDGKVYEFDTREEAIQKAKEAKKGFLEKVTA